MRDVVSRSKTAIKFSYKQYEGGGRGPITSTITQVFVSDVSGRADLVRSNHRVATPYNAYREMWQSIPYLRYGVRAQEATIVNGKVVYVWYRLAEEGLEKPSTTLSLVRVSTSSPEIEKAMTRARNNLLNGLAHSDVNIGTFLGELPESAKMILSTSIKVLQAYRACRRGNFAAIPKILGVSSVRTYLKTPASVWFSYIFGWKPLIEDIYNMHSSVQKQLSKPSVRKSSSTESFSPDRGTLPKELSVVTDVVGAKCTATFCIASSWVHNAQALGLLNPLAIAWELFPMSFVFDWFIPIGGFISNVTATAGLQFLHGYETRYAKAECRYQAYLSGTTGIQPGSLYTGFSFTRRVLTTFPKPALDISLNLNRNQVLVLLGLLSQRI